MIKLAVTALLFSISALSPVLAAPIEADFDISCGPSRGQGVERAEVGVRLEDARAHLFYRGTAVNRSSFSASGTPLGLRIDMLVADGPFIDGEVLVFNRLSETFQSKLTGAFAGELSHGESLICEWKQLGAIQK